MLCLGLGTCMSPSHCRVGPVVMGFVLGWSSLGERASVSVDL